MKSIRVSRGHVEMFLATTTWAIGSGLLIKSVSPSVPATVMYATNALFGMLSALAYFLVRNPKLLRLPTGVGDLKLLAGGGFSLTMSGIMMITAIQMTLVAKATLIRSLMPVVLIFIAAPMFLGETPTKRERFAAVVGLLGLVCIMSQRVGDALIDLGALIAIASMLFSVANVVMKRLMARRKISPEAQTVYQNAISVLMVAPFAVYFMMESDAIGARDWCIMALNGALTRGLGFILWYRGNQDGAVSSAQVGIFTYIEPLGATALACVVLGEPLSMPIVIGAACIVAAGLLPLRK